MCVEVHTMTDMNERSWSPLLLKIPLQQATLQAAN